MHTKFHGIAQYANAICVLPMLKIHLLHSTHYVMGIVVTFYLSVWLIQTNERFKLELVQQNEARSYQNRRGTKIGLGRTFGVLIERIVLQPRGLGCLISWQWVGLATDGLASANSWTQAHLRRHLKLNIQAGVDVINTFHRRITTNPWNNAV